MARSLCSERLRHGCSGWETAGRVKQPLRGRPGEEASQLWLVLEMLGSDLETRPEQVAQGAVGPRTVCWRASVPRRSVGTRWRRNC